MEKASSKELMSLEEWEFLDYGHDGKDLSQKLFFDPKGIIINMNYFICPSHSTPPIIPPHPAVETNKTHQDGDGGDGDDRLRKQFKDIPVVLSDQDPVAQVFFKKMMDTEFVDMKMGSPKASTKLIVPHVEPDPILFDEEEGLYNSEEVVEDKVSKNSTEPRDEDSMCSENKGRQFFEGIGFTVLWRWRVNGIGAICSIGAAAAATICIFILGSKQHQHQHQHRHQKIQFQIYTEDKRIKQAVQQATRLNQAMSAMRGAPISRAHISFGGYYDGL